MILTTQRLTKTPWSLKILLGGQEKTPTFDLGLFTGSFYYQPKQFHALWGKTLKFAIDCENSPRWFRSPFQKRSRKNAEWPGHYWNWVAPMNNIPAAGEKLEVHLPFSSTRFSTIKNYKHVESHPPIWWNPTIHSPDFGGPTAIRVGKTFYSSANLFGENKNMMWKNTARLWS